MDLLSDFQAYINHQNLWQADDRLLLAFSGGMDSTLLAHLLQHIGADFGLAHVNYGLRKEADADEAWCHNYAAHINRPFHSTRFDTPTLHKAQGGSLQALARDLRYEWLETVRQQKGYQYILVAHHQDDALETLLLNLLRGTGLRGLKGILPKREQIRRPLLFASRKTLEDFAHAEGLSWREDSSNAQPYYSRNKIRHQLMPLLRELQPDLDQRIGTTLHNLQSVNHFYQIGVAQDLKTHLVMDEDSQRLPIPVLLTHPHSATLLHEWLSPFGFKSSATAEMITALKKGIPTGKKFLSESHEVSVQGEALFLHPILEVPDTIMLWEEGQDYLTLPDGQAISYKELSEPPTPLPNDLTTACVDARNFKFPVLLRRWQPGDRMAPLGMGGQTRKLQDLFSDAKWSNRQKSEAWIVESQGHIVWIPYLRTSEAVKIKPDTSQCFVLHWHSKI